MSHTEAVKPTAPVMTDAKTMPSGRSYAATLSALVADPSTTYRLRQLIQQDQVLQGGAGVAEAERLARLESLIREDAVIEGPREVPPGAALHTAQERAEAFKMANAINALEGYDATAEDLELQRGVVQGDLTSEQAVQEILGRVRGGSVRRGHR